MSLELPCADDAQPSGGAGSGASAIATSSFYNSQGYGALASAVANAPGLRPYRLLFSPGTAPAAAPQNIVQDQCNGGTLKDSEGNAVNSPVNDPFGAITSDSAFRILLPGAQFSGLSNFKQGGKFDFQRYGTDGKSINFAWKSISTIGIGYYASINNIPYSAVMSIQNAYAGAFSNFGNVPMDKDYPNLPASNVANTKIGYAQAGCGRGRF